MNLRYRPAPDARPELVHTLNGSSLGMARTYAAFLETHLQPDGSILLPEAVRRYCRGGRHPLIPPAGPASPDWWCYRPGTGRI